VNTADAEIGTLVRQHPVAEGGSFAASGLAAVDLPAWLPDGLASVSKGLIFASPVHATRLLAEVVSRRGCTLLIDGQEESAHLIFASKGLLPVVAMQAHFRARSLLGFSFGARFESDPQALLGVDVDVPLLDGAGAGTCRAAFLLDAVERVFGLSPGARIECMPVVNLYSQGLLAQPEEAVWPIARTLGPL